MPGAGQRACSSALVGAPSIVARIPIALRRVDAKMVPRYFPGMQGCAPLPEERAMEDAEIGWIAAIIFGGIAGWLAERFMKSDMGLLMYRTRHRRSGNCQRHFQLLWHRARRMDRLRDRRICRRVPVNLDRPRIPRPHSVRTTRRAAKLLAPAKQALGRQGAICRVNRLLAAGG